MVRPRSHGRLTVELGSSGACMGVSLTDWSWLRETSPGGEPTATLGIRLGVFFTACLAREGGITVANRTN